MACRVLYGKDCTITSPFGMRVNPVSGIYKLHRGVDLVGAGYTLAHITAHTGGRVARAEYNASLGYYVNILLENGDIMQYCHMTKNLQVAVGDTVSQGQIIGTMGSTGNSTGAHLHFGIMRDKEWIDPAPYLYEDYLEEEMAIYTYLEDVPASYQPTIQKLVEAGVLKGTGNGELNVDETYCRVMTTLDRLGILEKE